MIPTALGAPPAGPATGFACRICRSTTGRHVTATERMFGMGGEFDYFECGQCGCVQLTTVPDDLGRYYPPDRYYSFGAGQDEPAETSPTSWPRRQLRQLKASVHLFGRPRVLRFLRRFSPPAHYPLAVSLFRGVERGSMRSRVLDVGCGRGEQLAFLAETGFRDLHGVDPFLPADVRPPPGVTLHRSRIDELSVGGFDLITMNHSLEHVPDPVATLAAAAARLSPGGIVRVAIPTADSTAWREYGTEWVDLDAPRHLFIHTRQSMSIAAAAAGLEVWETEPQSDEFEFWAAELYRTGRTLHDPATGTTRTMAESFPPERWADFRHRSARANAADLPARRLFRLRHRRST